MRTAALLSLRARNEANGKGRCFNDAGTAANPSNSQNDGNKVGVKRRADHGDDDLMIADGFDTDMRTDMRTDQDNSINALLHKHNICANLEENNRRINAVVKPSDCGIKVYDDNTSRELSPALVAKARDEELNYVHKHGVYTKVPISMCYQEKGKETISTGWVNVSKGDDENPGISCRIVGKEFNVGKRHDVFAATPPLEANKLFTLRESPPAHLLFRFGNS